MEVAIITTIIQNGVLMNIQYSFHFLTKLRRSICTPWTPFSDSFVYRWPAAGGWEDVPGGEGRNFPRWTVGTICDDGWGLEDAQVRDMTKVTLMVY